MTRIENRLCWSAELVLAERACLRFGPPPVLMVEEREVNGTWLPHSVRRGDRFVTRSTTPYELRWRSPLGAELDVIHIHFAVDRCLAAFETVFKDKASDVEVTEFFGRDEVLAHLCFACAEMLSARTAATSQRVGAIAHLLANLFGREKFWVSAASDF